MAAHVERVEPLERGHARARRIRHRPLDGLDPLGRLRGELLAGLVGAGRGRARRGTSASTSPSVVGSSEITSGCVGSRSATARTSSNETAHTSHTACVTIRSTSSASSVVLVELVQRLAAAGPLAHRRVDPGRVEPLGDHAAREVGELFGAGRVVTLVGDRGDAVAEAEREQHLGRGRNQ